MREITFETVQIKLNFDQYIQGGSFNMLYRVCPNGYDNPVNGSLAATVTRTDGRSGIQAELIAEFMQLISKVSSAADA